MLQVLQNLGKADRTTDDDFARHVAAFNEQQVVISRSALDHCDKLKLHSACNLTQ